MNLQPLEERALLSLSFGLAFGFGGAFNDVGTEVATDTRGNIYVAGTFVTSNEQ